MGDGFEPRLTPVARAINDGMPLHVVDLTVQALREAGLGRETFDHPLDGAKVAVLGYAYRENTDDTRNSPSKVLVARLRGLGAEVLIHDPCGKWDGVEASKARLREMIKLRGAEWL